MRICSLLPSATEMIADLGFIDSLVGVSDECRWPPAVVGKPVVTATRIDPVSLTSLEIDRAVREAVGEGRSLYTVDAELIDDLRPDLIVTQDLCAVCAVSSGELAAACPVDAEVLSLDPHTLRDVADTVRTLAVRLDAADRGEQIVREMWATIEAVRTAVHGLARKSIFVAEWIDPPFSAGHWVPEMVKLAGGRDVLGLHGQPSYATTWEQVVEHEPELVVIAPCGFDADQAAERAQHLSLPCTTVAVDADSYYSRPAPRLADGVRQLGHLLHPDTVPDPGLPAIELQRMSPARADTQRARAT